MINHRKHRAELERQKKINVTTALCDMLQLNLIEYPFIKKPRKILCSNKIRQVMPNIYAITNTRI
jgi:hypothetical protein